MSAMPKVAVVGGSIGGLTAALTMRDVGCDVTVYEKSPETLHARGAGIAVLEQTLRYPVRELGIDPAALSTRTQRVQFVDRAGVVTHAEERTYRFSAWNTIYTALLEAFPADRYVLDRELTSFEDDGAGVTLRFAHGDDAQADLLVCADGVTSASRSTLFPDVVPEYSGYVGWRGVVPESELSSDTFEALHDALTYQLLPDSHILVYPIPGLKGEVEEGQRLMNMVWYRNVPADELDWFMTDRTGFVRTVSLPPTLARDEVIDEMRRYASDNLAPAVREMVTSVAEPFVQAVLDIAVPRMASGRVCIMGDAAFAVRPHAAAGTAKAAEDGWVLAEELERSHGDVPAALSAWNRRQLALGTDLLARTREVGDLSQSGGGLVPGDPRLVFGLHEPGR
jgi:2,6-dihydroxypyridine 3-monooxygenase